MSKKTSQIHEYSVVHIPAVDPNLHMEDNTEEHLRLVENIGYILDYTSNTVILVVEGLISIGEQTMLSHQNKASTSNEHGKHNTTRQPKLFPKARNADLAYSAIGSMTLLTYWWDKFSEQHSLLWNAHFPDMSISPWITERMQNFKNEVYTALDAWVTPLILANDTDVIRDVCNILHPEIIYCMVNKMQRQKNTPHKIIHTRHLKDRELHAAMQDSLWEIGAEKAFRDQILGLLRTHAVQKVTFFDGLDSTLIEHMQERATTGTTFLA